MTTLSPTMSLLALVKTGTRLENRQGTLRLYKVNQSIVVFRFVPNESGRIEQEFPLTGAGLKQAIDYFNLPF